MSFWFLVPSKFLSVYDFGIKMYTSQPITALLARKGELCLAEGYTFSCQNRTLSGTLTVAFYCSLLPNHCRAYLKPHHLYGEVTGQPGDFWCFSVFCVPVQRWGPLGKWLVDVRSGHYHAFILLDLSRLPCVLKANLTVLAYHSWFSLPEATFDVS